VAKISRAARWRDEDRRAAERNGQAKRPRYRDPEDEYPEDQRGDAWEPPSDQETVVEHHPLTSADGIHFALLNSAQFAATDYRLEWLVKRLVVKGQPGILGGPRKGLKTSIAIDLAISAGSGMPFLGQFEIAKRCRVALMSGESGEATIKETALRVCRAKGIDLASVSVFWGFQLPQLTQADHLGALQDALKACGAEVLILDPLYLCLLSGSDPSQASNLMAMGPIYMTLAQVCLSIGCTPILAHHFRLTRANQYDEPQLEDLAYSGVQEFARQWLLLGRREAYQPGTGQHKLWLSAGGSAGQSGLWAVDVDEGVTGEDFRGRVWELKVTTATEVRQAAHDQREQERRDKQARKEHHDENNFLAVLDRLDHTARGVALAEVGRQFPFSRERCHSAFARLKSQRIVEDVPGFTVETGNSARRAAHGIRRRRRD
jgi:replicative DNA helicase